MDDDSIELSDSEEILVEVKNEVEFAKSETQQICCMRTTFVIIFMIGTAIVSSAMFYISRTAEDEQFELAYDDSAKKLISTFNMNVATKVRSVESLSLALSSYARYTNQTWPFVTFGQFSIRGAGLRTLANAVAVALWPLVTKENQDEWGNYSSMDHLGWIQTGLGFEQNIHELHNQRLLSAELAVDKNLQEDIDQRLLAEEVEVAEYIFNLTQGQKLRSDGPGPFFPLWQSSPVVPELVNYDLYSNTQFRSGVNVLLKSQLAVIDKVYDWDRPDHVLEIYSAHWAHTSKAAIGRDPISQMYVPVFDELRTGVERKTVGIVTADIFWATFMDGSLEEGTPAIVAVLKNECQQVFSYNVQGDEAVYMGPGDLHDPAFDNFERFGYLTIEGSQKGSRIVKGLPLNEDFCRYSITLYPTEEFEDEFHSTGPLFLTIVIILIFFFTGALVVCFDLLVEYRQKEVVRSAAKANDIVASLFPSRVREKLYNGGGGAALAKPAQLLASPGLLSEPQESTPEPEYSEIISSGKDSIGKPIAELFPETTVFFAAIVGFTAWSSQREPAEVFILLQTMYQCFDSLAKKHGVYKIETIGESYVAVTGIPEPQHDHAIRMARFARECMHRVPELTRGLEVELGPDTGDLQIRIGLHSGPVTAGVLRGEKSRFQLFGDTVNTAARMESNAPPNRMQCSVTTADLLFQAEKGAWLREREDRVKAKGKGEVQTYWLLPRSGSDASSGGDIDDLTVDDSMNSPGVIIDMTAHMSQNQRRIDWHVGLLSQLLKQIALRRMETASSKKYKQQAAPEFQFKVGLSAVDEVTEAIELPKFEAANKTQKRSKPSLRDVALDGVVIAQLKDYVTTIASMYRDNKFHNFEHATHVAMCTNKLMKRVVAKDEEISEAQLHEYTHGMTSNPLTQFALVFCALIHDVDHSGVSNSQLIKEETLIAKLYSHRSVAEQNSVDISWDLLLDPVYADLRSAIYSNEAELQHFRQLVVNIVLATDMFDKHMKDIREKRWDKAFLYAGFEEEKDEMKDRPPANPTVDGVNLKATIVMEHLIQASDIAHTMQHWDVYIKWNEKLFQEMSTAFDLGRAPKNPAFGWYEGEIMFFDKYIIPLANKLHQCGVFGVSSDECLNYALHNRTLWAVTGDAMVEQFKVNYMESKRKRCVSKNR